MLTDHEAGLLAWAIRANDKHFGTQFAYILAGDLGVNWIVPMDQWEVLLAIRTIQKAHLDA